jgi:hypothetical protein
MGPRTIISVIRTAVYGTIAGVFAISSADAMQVVDAAVIGGVLADYATWLVRSMVTLPVNLAHGCYEACINVAFGIFLFYFAHINIDYDAQSAAIGFLTFLAVGGLKVTYYMMALVESVERE